MDYFLSRAVSKQTKVFYPKMRNQGEQRKARGKAVKSGRGGNPDKNSSIIKIFIVYEFLLFTRFLCEKSEQRKLSAKSGRDGNPALQIK